MRILAIILVAALFGGAVGGSMAYVEVRSERDVMAELTSGDSTPAPTKTDGTLPRVVVDQARFNFGVMERGREKSHEFVIRNEGNAPLTLRVGPTSCKCTLSEVDSGAIAPGESTRVKLAWSAKSDEGPFRQTATIFTNDPLQPDVHLEIDGEIVLPTGVQPPDFNFDKLAVDEVKSASVYVMAMLQDDLKIKSTELASEDVADKFDIKIEPVEPAELPAKAAKAGVHITITTKPGLPLGRFSQYLTLDTNLKEGEKLHVPILGRVVGDISVHGKNWRETEGVLQMGSVDRSEGRKERVNVVVRGDNAEDVKFEVASVDPPELQVKIGEPQRLKSTLLHVPVDIEVPAGTRTMNRLATAQGEEAKIVLKTTHPTMKELAIGVRFAVGR